MIRFFQIRLKPFLFASLATLSLALSLLTSLPANAYNTVGDYSDDYQTVDHIQIGASNYYGYTCEPQDLSLDWSQYILDETKWYNINDPANQTMRTSFQNALDHGSWGVTQLTGFQSATSGYQHMVYVYWREDRNVPITFDGANSVIATQSNGVLISNRNIHFGNGGCEGIISAPQLGNNTYTVSNDLAPFTFTPTTAAESYGQANLFANYPVEYPAGYTGLAVKDSYQAPQIDTISPEIEYTVNNKKVTLKYKDNIQHQSCPVMNWSYSKQPDPTALDSQFDKDPDDPYEVEVAEYGKHIFIADLHVPTPCAPFPADPQVVPMLLTLDIDGSSFTGSTADLVCTPNGTDYNGCLPEESISCNEQDSFMDTMTCRFNKSVNMGLINPSINEFKNLFTSFTVSDPTCDIPVQNVALMPGHSFPLSDYSDYACTSAAQFRQAFPIAPILLNFFLAMVVLTMIVRIINRLLDHKHNDIIEGVA